MAIEASTRTDADTRLLFRIPDLLAPHARGVTSSLSQVLSLPGKVSRLEAPGISNDHYVFTTAAGSARVMLAENTVPGEREEKPKQVSLVGMWLSLTTEDGYTTPEVEIWYTGEYGLPGYFEGTNTRVHLSVNREHRRSTALMQINLCESGPAKLFSDRFGVQDAIPQNDGTVLLPGEQIDPVGLRVHDDITLYGVEGANAQPGYLAFCMMGKNESGVEKPVPFAVPKRLTVR